MQRGQANNNRLSLPYRHRCNQSRPLRQNAAKYRWPEAEDRPRGISMAKIQGRSLVIAIFQTSQI